MSPTYLMSLDAGGGGGHCLLVEIESGKLTRTFRPWRHPVARGIGGAAIDLDLDSIWSSVGEASREALGRAGARAEQVLGIAATSMRHSTIVLDSEGQVLFAAPNRDARAFAEGFELAAELGDEIYARTGHWPMPVASAARLRWLRKADPDAWKRAATVLTLGDWLTYRLCGERATEASQAAESLLFDLGRRSWGDGDLLERLEVPRGILPPVVAAGSRIGSLSPAAAESLGLRAATAVAVGGADTQCGLLGAGVTRPGQIAAIAGTTVPLQLVLERPTIDPRQRLWTGCHLMPGLWVLESNAGPMGESLDWLAQVLFPESPARVARLLAEAALSEPGASGILSTFGAEVMNARELQLPLGSLTLSHLSTAGDPRKRAHLARAVVDGMALALRANLDQLREIAAPQVKALRLAGGIARSELFARVVSDALGLIVELGNTAEATGLGAAICAGTGAGVFADLADGVARLAAPTRQIEPDRERAEAYAEAYSSWQRLRAASVEATAAARQAVLPAVLRRIGGASVAARPAVRPRVLVTADFDDAALVALRKLGDVEYVSFRTVMRLLTGATLVEALQGVQVFITEVDVLDASVLEKLPELRVVAACRGEAVNVDTAACTACGIPVLRAPGRNADAVADLAVAFLLMLARRLPAATAFLHEPGAEAGDLGRMGRAFSTLQGRELWHKTVGLVGLGAVGRAVVRRLAGFGARILVHDPLLSADQVLLAGAEPVSLDELLERSDFVSLHAAVSDSSRGMIDARAIGRMKRGAGLVNTARAALVDAAALLDGLRSGQLGGAALDVFPVEPPAADDPLLSLDNVIATPHVGGNTADVASHQGELVVADLRRLLQGERPLNVLNPEVLDAFDWTKPRAPLDRAALARLAARPGPAVSDLQRDRAKPAATAPPRAAAPPVTAPAAPEAVPPSPAAPAETIDRMLNLLEGFVGRVSADASLRDFARGKDVTLRFTLPDVALRFFLRLRDGAVVAKVGDPDARPDVELKMRAEILDGMFTGKVNPMQAATSGRLSFSGDTVKAMTLQQIQDTLSLHYRAAREEVGDLGDLGALPGGIAVVRKPAAPPPPAATDLRGELLQVVNELYASELITATGGNVSVRIPGRDEIWITPGQIFKGQLRPEMLVRLDLDGQSLDPGALSPSSERLMHCAVYRARNEAQAVVHAHAPHATILANAGLPFLPISTEAAFFGDIPRVPFIMPGTEELARAVGEAMRTSWAVLMRNHGLIVAGRSLRRAADMVEIIDRSAEVILGCYAVGREPPTLPREVVETLQKMGDLMA